MGGISKVLMSSFFLLGLFLIVPGTAAQTDTSDMKCAALGADLSACVELFGFGVGAGADLGIDVTPPRCCCRGLQQIKASVAVLGAPRTCHCLRQSSIFRDHPNASINTAILDFYLASCSLALGADITTDLSCLR